MIRIIFLMQMIFEKSTNFNTLLTNEYNNIFEITCRLWKPFDNNLIIICETQDNMNPKNLRTISVIFKESFFNYGEHKIFINSKITLKLSVLDKLVPFLYSDKQEIKYINNYDDYYYLEFNMSEYHGQELFIGDENLNTIPFESCANNNGKLNCIIDYYELIKILQNENQKFYLYSFHNSYSLIKLNLVYEIYFKSIFKKRNLYLRITDLLTESINTNNFVAYKTNITSMYNVKTGYFYFKYLQANCYFYKEINTNLLIMLCKMTKEGTYSIGSIDSEFNLKNINIYYNFLIQPSNNDDKFNVKGLGSFIKFVAPIQLDFYSNDEIDVFFIMDNPYNSKGITFFEGSKELECNDLYAYEDVNEYPMKVCKITYDYFTKEGKYNVYYMNSENSLQKFYEIPEFNVILP